MEDDNIGGSVPRQRLLGPKLWHILSKLLGAFSFCPWPQPKQYNMCCPSYRYCDESLTRANKETCKKCKLCGFVAYFCCGSGSRRGSNGNDAHVHFRDADKSIEVVTDATAAAQVIAIAPLPEADLRQLVTNLQQQVKDQQGNIDDQRKTIAMQGKQIVEQGKTIAMQGKQIVEQGKTIAMQGKQIDKLLTERQVMRETIAMQGKQIVEMRQERQESLRTSKSNMRTAFFLPEQQQQCGGGGGGDSSNINEQQRRKEEQQ